MKALDAEDRTAFFEDFKNSEGRWISVGSAWANFLRDHVLIPSGCDAIAEALCNDMMEFADTEDTVLDLLKELAGEKIEAESIASEEEEDEDASSDRNALVNMICKTVTYDDSSKLVNVEVEDEIKQVPLALFGKIAHQYKLMPPSTIGNEGKWIWKRTVAGKDYIKTDRAEEHKLSFV